MHEKVASMRHVEDHKDERTVEDGLLTFEIGHDMVHKIVAKVRMKTKF